MNITFHSFANQAAFFFKERLVTALTDQHKKILIIFGLAMSVLALCYALGCRYFNAKPLHSGPKAPPIPPLVRNPAPPFSSLDDIEVPDGYEWVRGRENVKRFMESDAGKNIEYQYEHNGVVYGKETVERREAVHDLKESLKKRDALIQEKLKEIEGDLNTSSEEIQTLKEELKLCQKAYSNAETVEDEFIKSSFFRNELTKARKGTKSFAQAVEKISLGAPVNFRYQMGKAGDKEVGFFRLGVATDPRNGFTHLKELKEAMKNPQVLEEKIETLEKRCKTLLRDPVKNKAEIESIQYALSQMRPEKIKSTVRERQFILENQMLQLVQGQIEKNLAKLDANKDQETFSLVHLGLLNRKTDTIDCTGWMHHEANQMEDMNEIFKEFAGRTVIFDGKGPYIDLESNVHVAQKLTGNDGKPRTVTLKPTFVNLSVQGHMKNDGIQEEINEKGINELLKEAYQLVRESPRDRDMTEGALILAEIQRKLQEGKSNYQMAEDLAVVLLKLGIHLSMGCLSAKDRTGVVAARAILRFVEESMAQHPQLKNNEKEFKRLKHKFETSILDKGACAARIVEDNTKITVLKCSAFDLPGYSKGDLGKLRRINYYFKQMAVA